MIAVLPFDNLGGSPEQESFNGGVITETITALGRLCPDRLGVISRISVMLYKQSAMSPEEVGRELNVSYILEGTSHVEVGRIRVNVALVSVKDKTALWSRATGAISRIPSERRAG